MSGVEGRPVLNSRGEKSESAESHLILFHQLSGIKWGNGCSHGWL